MPKKREEKEDTKHLFLRGNVWWIQATRDGKKFVRTTGESEIDAARDVRDRELNPMNLKDEVDRTQAVLERVRTKEAAYQDALLKKADEEPATNFGDAWETYLAQQNRPDSGPVTLGQYKGWFDAFARWMAGTYPDVKELRRVTQEHGDRYAGKLLKTVSATTFNRHVNTLTLVWRVLGKAARLPANPWKEITRRRFVVHSRRELTVEELGRIFNAAKGEMRVLLALGTFCGLRLGDAANLKWSEVDMVKGIISLVPHKTARRSQKRVTLPIHRALHALLDEIPKSQRHGYVMPAMAARHQSFNAALAKDVADLFLSVNIKTNPNAMTAAEKEAAKEARAARAKAKAEGLELPKPKPKPQPKGDRARADCGFHSLRHTFVSLCAAGGVPQSVVQSLVGHGSPAMTQHYTHIALETAQKAVETLPDVTRVAALPERVNASEAEMAGVEKVLERMTKAQLQGVAVKVKALIGKVGGTI